MGSANQLFNNRLLASVTDDGDAAWLGELEPVTLRAGEVLHQPGALIKHVYFPATAIVSLIYETEKGQSSEIAVIGEEGIIGIALFMGGRSTPLRAVVQRSGSGWRMNADALLREFERGGALMHSLLRYTQALMTQTTQAAVCNRYHSLEQRLCRWLLLHLDRSQSNQIDLTQQSIANLLGVRREGVTQAAGRLNESGLIESRRSRLSVIDREGLESRVCECYAVVKSEYDRLVPAQRRAALTYRPTVTRSLRHVSAPPTTPSTAIFAAQ